MIKESCFHDQIAGTTSPLLVLNVYENLREREISTEKTRSKDTSFLLTTKAEVHLGKYDDFIPIEIQEQ